MSAHTPRPWEVERQDATGRYTIAKGLTVVATVPLESDARLIAAAPRMLDFIRTVLTETEDRRLFVDAHAILRDVEGD